MRAGDKVVMMNENGEKDFNKIYTVSHFYISSSNDKCIKILGSDVGHLADNFIKLKESEYISLKPKKRKV